jgi:hypothetical protein
LYVAGTFTGIAGSNSRDYLAAFGLSRTNLLTDFDPKADGYVRCLCIYGNSLYVGGDFSNIGGQTRSCLAAIDPVTGQDSSFWDAQVGVSGQLRVQALVAAGNTMYVGGSYTSIGGEFRKRLAGINATFPAANAWNPGPDQTVYAVVRTSDALLIGGEFTAIGTHPCPYFAAFSTKPSFTTGSAKFNPTGKFQMEVNDGDGTDTEVMVQANDNASNGQWQTIWTAPVSGIPTVVEDPVARANAYRLYRAVVTP